MTKESIKKRIELVVSALEAAGYNPFNQLTGYLETGDISYITRTNGARDIASTIDTKVLRDYVEAHR